MMIWKKVVQLTFTIILVICFIVLFGKPALDKYQEQEVFLKRSTEPRDRSKVLKIHLPAITLCASDASSMIFQVRIYI